MVDTWNTNTNTNTNTYPDVDPANDYQVGEQTGSYVGIGSGYDTNTTNNTNNTNNNQNTPDPVDARSAALAAQAEESKNNYLLGIAEMMQGMDEPPLSIDPETGQAIRSGGFKRFNPETGEPDWNAGQEYVDPFTGIGDKGALLSDIERAQLFANQLGTGLGSLIATDDFGMPILDSSGKIITTGLGQNLMDNWGQTVNAFAGLGDLSGKDYLEQQADSYWKSRDEQWYGSDYWDDYLGEYYGPTEQSAYEKNKRWQQKSLGEILQEGPVGFSDLQRIYGEELSETSANPFAAVSQYNKQGAFSPSFGESIITEYS